MASVDNPCGKVRPVDPMSAFCIGCGRTPAEIAGSIGLSAHERPHIMADLPRRLAMPAHDDRAELC